MLKKTAGDFDPLSENLYFIASDANSTLNEYTLHDYTLIALNELRSKKNLDQLEQWIERGKKVFIDSGIYFLTQEHMKKHNTTMNEALALAPEEIDGFDKLFDKYIEVIRRFGNTCWGYIELDQGGRENKIKTRTKLEAMGLQPIPVYHPLNDGWDYFDYLAENYDRICFGNIVQADTQTRQKLIYTAWERHRKYPDLWIHLLGFTPNEWMLSMPINSCDSSAWLSSIRWSGYKPRAALTAFSELPRHFQYKLGETTSDVGKFRALAMSSYGAMINQRIWNYHLRELENIGITIYPEIKP